MGEEERADEAERERDDVKHRLVSVERKLEEARREMVERDEVVQEHARDEVESGGVARVARLEVDNSLLQSSLQDIATMVVEDADVEAKSGGRPKPVLPGRSPLARRARSASPAMVESTVTAVQAALNKRQLQLHELQVRSSGQSEKLRELERKGQWWEKRCKDAERKLEETNEEVE